MPYYCRCCPLPAYCSTACRDADAFHQPGGPECGLPWTVLLPVEAVAALRLARRLRQLDRGDGTTLAAAAQVASLGTHLAELHASEFVQLAALAAVAHATWQQAARAQAADSAGAGHTAQQPPDDDVSAGDVLAALLRLQINGLAVVPPERRGAADRRGLALYPVGSLMNHACQPNLAVRFEVGAPAAVQGCAMRGAVLAVLRRLSG